MGPSRRPRGGLLGVQAGSLDQRGRTAAKALKLNPSYGASPFTDVNDPYVTAMYDAGCVTGSFDAAGNRLYRPTASIQRSEISTIVWHMVF